MDQNENIGKRIRFVRRLIGMTRQILASKYDIEYVTFSHWETGKVKLTDKMIHQCVQIFLKEGVVCTFDWIKEGSGDDPKFIGNKKEIIEHLKQKNIFNMEFQFFLDIEAYAEHNPTSIVYQLKNKAMSPLFNVGDVVGGQVIHLEDVDKAHLKKCIISIEEGKFMVRNFFIRKNKFILTADNTASDVINPLVVHEKPLLVAPINFYRKAPHDDI